MPNIFGKLWNSAPKYWFPALKRRMLRRPIWDWDYSLSGILSRRNHLQPATLIDRWHRYWRVIEMQTPYKRHENFNFEGRVVMELGCGPLLGWGPMAIFLGADKFIYEEPWLKRDVLFTDEIRELYLRPLFDELTANFGARQTFEIFLEKVLNSGSMLSTEDDRVDIIISNSTLEHIPKEDLSILLLKYRQLCSEEAVYLHAVDFGDHQNREKGFGDMYEGPNHPRHGLNFLRKPDLEDVIKEAGFSIYSSMIYRSSPASPSHPDWDCYEVADLEARVVLFIGSIS